MFGLVWGFSGWHDKQAWITNEIKDKKECNQGDLFVSFSVLS
ncbi:hypothetical protein [Tropheryma whipplei]|nr:hypothetical protein [Tropheryma whipplei]